MVVGLLPMRQACRSAFQSISHSRVPVLSTLGAIRHQTTEAAAPRGGRAPKELSWADQQEKTRLVPVSPSYFTGNPDFFDNLLALQELQRKYELLPTIPKMEAQPGRWLKLVQYSGLVGRSVQASKYKQIVDLLDRLNCIEPSLMPTDVKVALDMYRKEDTGHGNEAKVRTVDELGRGYGTGRRKSSSARVYVLEGDGQVVVNGRLLAEYFERLHDRESAIWPLLVTDRVDKYNVWINVNGGGKTGQAEAITLGLARALMVHEPALKPALRKGKIPAGNMTLLYGLADLGQLVALLVIRVGLRGRSLATSRPARCLPGSSVDLVGSIAVFYLYILCRYYGNKKGLQFSLWSFGYDLGVEWFINVQYRYKEVQKDAETYDDSGTASLALFLSKRWASFFLAISTHSSGMVKRGFFFGFQCRKSNGTSSKVSVLF